VLSLVLVPAAFAGKGGGPGGGGNTGGGGGTITGPVMVTDANGDGMANYGDTVTFNVSTTATSTPYVDLTCSQNGAMVYSATSGYFPSYPWPWTKDMNLASQMWTGGQASCTATLYTFNSKARKQTLATLSFTAAA